MGGISERVGNASLERVVAVLVDLQGIDTGSNQAKLAELADIVAAACRPKPG
jgi:isopropylmalate/homocitrate/citramalate synthase